MKLAGAVLLMGSALLVYRLYQQETQGGGSAGIGSVDRARDITPAMRKAFVEENRDFLLEEAGVSKRALLSAYRGEDKKRLPALLVSFHSLVEDGHDSQAISKALITQYKKDGGTNRDVLSLLKTGAKIDEYLLGRD